MKTDEPGILFMLSSHKELFVVSLKTTVLTVHASGLGKEEQQRNLKLHCYIFINKFGIILPLFIRWNVIITMLGMKNFHIKRYTIIKSDKLK